MSLTAHLLFDGSAPGSHPLVYELECLFLGVWAVIEAVFHEHLHDLPHRGTGRDPEVLHDLVSVDRRTKAVELLLFGQLRDAALEFVDLARNRPRALFVSRGHVTSNQLVEVFQQLVGVWGRMWRNTSCDTSRTASLGNLSSRMRDLVIRAPTTSW